jgi:hypothetical protein
MAAIILAVFYLANMADTSSLALNVLIKIAVIAAGAMLIVWFALDRKPAMALAGNVLRSLKTWK